VPAGLRARYFVRANRIVIKTPYVIIPGCLPAWCLLALGLLGWLVYAFVNGNGQSAGFVCPAIVGGFVLFLGYFTVQPEQTIFEVDPERLSIRQRGLLFRGFLFGRRWEIPAGEIQGVELQGGLLVILNARGKMELQLPVGSAEVAWIRAVLCRVLAC
jgi:hypothetical protein